MREYELYNAVYCGLCKSMGKKTRFYSRMTLSYDVVFLALVLSSLHNEKFETYKGKCGLNPLRKKLIAKDNGILRYCAAASAQLSYYSALDSVRDEKGFKKLRAKLSMPAIRRMKKAADGVYPFDDGRAEELIEELHALEEERSPSLDRTADVSGRLLGYYFECGAPEDKKQSAYLIGRMAGRFIYAADACDDLHKDSKSGAYNPLIYGDGEINEKLKRAFGAMCIWADEAAGELALEGADGHAYDVAENVMRLGMVDTARSVTDKDNKGRKKGRNGKRSV